MAREGQICPTKGKLSKMCPNQCETNIFFSAFLEYFGKFRNCQGGFLKNLLYFLP
jgi:hypothetical protein